jgi:hypothetical protein
MNSYKLNVTNSTGVNLLMERLRIQSILQRLIRAQGREQALDTVLEAIRLEFPESQGKLNEKNNKTHTAKTHT